MSGNSEKQPNIIFILTDDHGQWALGAYGNKEVRSPVLDELADTGVRFDDFYCTSPVCSPSRASIMTGKLPSQHGVHDWIGAGNISRDLIDNTEVSLKDYLKVTTPEVRKSILEGRKIEDISSEEKLELNRTFECQKYKKFEDTPIQYLEGQPTYTEILARNGYECGLVGKWHLGDSATAQCGMTYWKTLAGGGTLYKYGEFIEDGELVYKTEYATDVITSDAIEFIENNTKNNKPFCININYNAPHDPWEKEDQPIDIYESYDNCKFESAPDEPIHPWQAQKRFIGDTPEKRRKYLQGYYTAITAMDKSVGKLLKKLDELGIREDTVIIFTGDNGQNMGHHGIWGKGNGTFPQNMYDTSVKVPMIVNHLGRIDGKRSSEAMLSQYDLMPTILDYAGVDYKFNNTYPGSSFADILDGVEEDKERPVVIYDEYGPVRMIRTKEYKYVHRYPFGPHELYDLKTDPGENKNIIDEDTSKELIVEMRNSMEDWFMKYVDPNLDGATLPVTGEGQMTKANRNKSKWNTFIQE